MASLAKRQQELHGRLEQLQIIRQLEAEQRERNLRQNSALQSQRQRELQVQEQERRNKERELLREFKETRTRHRKTLEAEKIRAKLEEGRIQKMQLAVGKERIQLRKQLDAEKLKARRSKLQEEELARSRIVQALERLRATVAVHAERFDIEMRR